MMTIEAKDKNLDIPTLLDPYIQSNQLVEQERQVALKKNMIKALKKFRELLELSLCNKQLELDVKNEKKEKKKEDEIQNNSNVVGVNSIQNVSLNISEHNNESEDKKNLGKELEKENESENQVFRISLEKIIDDIFDDENEKNKDSKKEIKTIITMLLTNEYSKLTYENFKYCLWGSDEMSLFSNKYLSEYSFEFTKKDFDYINEIINLVEKEQISSLDVFWRFLKNDYFIPAIIFYMICPYFIFETSTENDKTIFALYKDKYITDKKEDKNFNVMCFLLIVFIREHIHFLASEQIVIFDPRLIEAKLYQNLLKENSQLASKERVANTIQTMQEISVDRVVQNLSFIKLKNTTRKLYDGNIKKIFADLLKSVYGLTLQNDIQQNSILICNINNALSRILFTLDLSLFKTYFSLFFTKVFKQEVITQKIPIDERISICNELCISFLLLLSSQFKQLVISTSDKGGAMSDEEESNLNSQKKLIYRWIKSIGVPNDDNKDVIDGKNFKLEELNVNYFWFMACWAIFKIGKYGDNIDKEKDKQLIDELEGEVFIELFATAQNENQITLAHLLLNTFDSYKVSSEICSLQTEAYCRNMRLKVDFSKASEVIIDKSFFYNLKESINNLFTIVSAMLCKVNKAEMLEEIYRHNNGLVFIWCFERNLFNINTSLFCINNYFDLFELDKGVYIILEQIVEKIQSLRQGVVALFDDDMKKTLLELDENYFEKQLIRNFYLTNTIRHIESIKEQLENIAKFISPEIKSIKKREKKIKNIAKKNRRKAKNKKEKEFEAKEKSFKAGMRKGKKNKNKYKEEEIKKSKESNDIQEKNNFDLKKTVTDDAQNIINIINENKNEEKNDEKISQQQVLFNDRKVVIEEIIEEKNNIKIENKEEVKIEEKIKVESKDFFIEKENKIEKEKENKKEKIKIEENWNIESKDNFEKNNKKNFGEYFFDQVLKNKLKTSYNKNNNKKIRQINFYKNSQNFFNSNLTKNINSNSNNNVWKIVILEVFPAQHLLVYPSDPDVLKYKDKKIFDKLLGVINSREEKKAENENIKNENNSSFNQEIFYPGRVVMSSIRNKPTSIMFAGNSHSFKIKGAKTDPELIFELILLPFSRHTEDKRRI